MDLELFKGSQSTGPGKPDNPAGRGQNYFFICNHEHPQIDLSRCRANSTDKNKTYHGKLFISINTLQDMFIGSGKIEKFAGRLHDTFSYVMTGNGKKTWNIPGSSLKGSVLTNLLMFLPEGVADFFSAGQGPAKVFFSDLPMTSGSDVFPKEIAARFSPKFFPDDACLKLYKKEYQNDIQVHGYSQGTPQNEHIAAIKTGSRFSGMINFKGLDEYEITMLVLALGNSPAHPFNFKIGGAKNRAMGLIRLEIDSEKSFYAHTLRDISLKNRLPFKDLQPSLEKIIQQIKQDYPKLDKLIKKIQGEYGQ